jgi:hypothetical protein
MTDTLTEMILGFSVILGVLVLYVITLYLRIRQARAHLKSRSEAPKDAQ